MPTFPNLSLSLAPSPPPSCISMPLTHAPMVPSLSLAPTPTPTPALTSAPPPKVAEAYLKEAGALPVNLKFMLEGQEEVLSPDLKELLRLHSTTFKADLCLSADGGQAGPGQGHVPLGLRCARLGLGGVVNGLGLPGTRVGRRVV